MKYKSVYIVVFLFQILLISNIITKGEPTIISISPEDEERLDHNPTLIINITNDKPMNILWYLKEKEATEWKLIGENNNVQSDIYHQEIISGTEEGTNYQWKVNISDEEGSIEKIFNFRRRGWQTVSSGWLTGGTIFNFSFSNTSSLQISPALEGVGIIRENMTSIKNNYTNFISFTLILITTPKIEKIWEGEYYVINEEIVGIYFYIDNQDVMDEIFKTEFNLYDPNGNIILSKILENNSYITELEKPVALNSSGLWKIRLELLEFDQSKNFQMFENVSRWIKDKNDDKRYLSFSLEPEANLSFKNYYERSIPIFTLSETIGLQQMFLAEQQGEHLKDTADYLEKVSDNIAKSIEDAGSQTRAAWAVAIIASIGLIATFIVEKLREKKKINNLFRALYSEILLNLKTVNDFLGKGSKNIKETTDIDLSAIDDNLPFSVNCYINILASGELISKIKNMKLVGEIMSAYKTIQYYNTPEHHWNRVHFQRLQNKLKKLKTNLSKELTFLK